MNRHLILALAAGCFAGLLILQMGSGALNIIVPLVLLAFPRRMMVTIMFLGAFFPAGPGGPVLGGIRVTLFDILAPLLLIELVVSGRWPVKRPVISRIHRYAILGMIFLGLGLLFSFVRNPAGTRTLLGGLGTSYGLKYYYYAFACFCGYAVITQALTSELIEPHRLISALAYAGLIIGIVRVANYLGIIGDVPFFERNLRYMSYEGGVSSILMQTHRIGGLDQAGGYGFLAAYTGWVTTAKRRFLLLSLACAGLLIFGGGRSAFAGVSLALLLYISRKGMRNVFRTLIPITVAYILLTRVSAGDNQPLASRQLDRISQLLQGTRQFDTEESRLEGYKSLFEHWRENPLIGSGIAALSREETGAIETVGGHGAYISLLGLFGLFGMGFIILFVLVPLSTCVRKLIGRGEAGDAKSSGAAWLLLSMLLVLESILMIAGGSGYAQSALVALVASVSALDSKELLDRRPATNHGDVLQTPPLSGAEELGS